MNPNAVHCGLCKLELPEPVELHLERHILLHQVPRDKEVSPALQAALSAYRAVPDEHNLVAIIANVRAEERLRFQNLVQAAEEVAFTAGRVRRQSLNTGPTFWYDI